MLPTKHAPRKEITLELDLYPHDTGDSTVFLPLTLITSESKPECPVYGLAYPELLDYLIEYLRVNLQDNKPTSTIHKPSTNPPTQPPKNPNPSSLELTSSSKLKVIQGPANPNQTSDLSESEIYLEISIYAHELAQIASPDQWELLNAFFSKSQSFFPQFLKKHTRKNLLLNTSLLSNPSSRVRLHSKIALQDKTLLIATLKRFTVIKYVLWAILCINLLQFNLYLNSGDGGLLKVLEDLGVTHVSHKQQTVAHKELDLGYTVEKFFRVNYGEIGGEDFFGLDGGELRVSSEGFEKGFDRVVDGVFGGVLENGRMGGRVEFGG
jgi:hypothetical protein